MHNIAFFEKSQYCATKKQKNRNIWIEMTLFLIYNIINIINVINSKRKVNNL